MATGFKRGGYPVFQMQHTAAVSAYQPVKIGLLIVVPQVDAEANVEFAAHIPGGEAVITLLAEGAITKAAGLGQKLYSDDNQTTHVQAASSNGTFIGYGLNQANVANDGEIDVLTMGPGS